MEVTLHIGEGKGYWEHLLLAHTQTAVVTVVSVSLKQSSVWEDPLTMFGLKKQELSHRNEECSLIVFTVQIHLFERCRHVTTTLRQHSEDTSVDDCMHKQMQKVSHLSLSATKMTLRSSKREAKTRTTCRMLRQENRLSKSTCSSLESMGLLNSITWGKCNTMY